MNTVGTCWMNTEGVDTAFEPVEIEEAATEVLTECPACNSRNIARWCRAKDRWLGRSQQQFVYSKCRSCRLLFQSKRPLECDVGQFYPLDYGPYTGVTKSSEVRGRWTAFLERLFCMALAPFGWMSDNSDCAEVFTRHFASEYQCPESGSWLLDFGCGSDRFLNKARSRGWKTVGVDFAAAAVEKVIASGHEGFVADESLWGRLHDNKFQLVRMSHVLEHLYDPQAVMRNLYSKTKEGGRLHIAIPNPRSATCQLFRSYWFGLDAPRHIMLFDSKNIVPLLSEAGFNNISVIQEPVTKDAARSWAYWLRARDWITHDQVGSYLDREPFNSRLLPAVNYFASRGRADRIHVFADK